MKRFIAIIIAVLCLATSYFIFSDFAVNFEKITLENALKKDKYTEKEYKEFQNGLDDKSFYYYNTLTDSQKDSYITLYYSALDFDESCKVEIAEKDLSKQLFLYNTMEYKKLYLSLHSRRMDFDHVFVHKILRLPGKL